MRFEPTELAGVLRVELEPIRDVRGFFARTYCQRECAEAGIPVPMVQDSLSFNAKAGTLRGMHYHAAPFKQTRLVRCLAGAAFVVALDLRPKAPSYLCHLATELSPANRSALFVPAGLALGFQTLLDDTEIYYQMSEFYDSQYERGVRWNDPRFGIEWPEADRTILNRDASYPDFDDQLVENLE
jgi:dTDP-4-dehydrorhamnose 3,5-epimerase